MRGHSTIRLCKQCNISKPLDQFPLWNYGKTKRVSATCRSCSGITTDNVKRCTDCKTIKPVEEFANQRTTSGYWTRGSICQPCRSRRMREWNAKHSTGKLLNGNLIKSHGITLAEYNAILAAQGGVCAICGLPPLNTNKRNRRLSVDHCHDCGANRKLLCSRCNNGIGCFNDDPKLLLKAIEYLTFHICNHDG